jgi:arsenate reductase-like glutaredoxin family protein
MATKTKKRSSKKKAAPELINLKVTPAERAKLVAKAKRYTRGNVSELLRQAALKYAA